MNDTSAAGEPRRTALPLMSGCECPPDVLASLVTDLILLVNERQCIVYANREFSGESGRERCDAVGKTLGEALNCRHAAGRTCGACEACVECGWFQALKGCDNGLICERDCRILTLEGKAFDFAVKAVPIPSGRKGEALWACGLKDAFAQKRLRVLERSFFHDVTNLAVGIRGMFEILENSDAEESAVVRGMLQESAGKLVSAIERLRTLRVAENGDLRIWRSSQNPCELLQSLAQRYREEAETRHLRVVIENLGAAVTFETDRELFFLVVGELLANAIEASSRDDVVTLGFTTGAGQIEFYVKNQAAMSPAEQAHVFERSFTTKGSGHGIGTYCAKLIVEHYLKGTVRFSSHACGGTEFCVSYPLLSFAS
ncbi:MAG TPA: HAMP domain-containing sensor histidine kinase [Kiritimatiellia bacterium]|nr:HAMP domain-containing sensor histidine kinase [Kiritimatiellia bacterium]HPS06562.1 HAMP domain-containing sensor histidine kinase [Kiritimatiellia bacterium]